VSWICFSDSLKRDDYPKWEFLYNTIMDLHISFPSGLETQLEAVERSLGLSTHRLRINFLFR
jgi:hypothetical protein